MDQSRSAASGSTEDIAPDALLRQNQDLRRRLEDEAASYKRRLETYRQAQQHQAALVSRLQAKVLQYKQRCAELENQMVESLPGPDTPIRTKSVSGPPPSLEMREDRIHDLETALRRLDEERRK
ncbi:Rootletin [Blattella germanica]|nr:Rootletin [Blattella germanica]